MARTMRVLTLATLTGIALGGLASPASARPVDPVTHTTAYWEARLSAEAGFEVTCHKTELKDGTRTLETADALFVWVKAGREYYWLPDAVEGLLTTSKDISFVITCVGGDDQPPS